MLCETLWNLSIIWQISACVNGANDKCNCDANDNIWRSDDGDLNDKTTLPVTELRFGDTGHVVEKVIYKVGALKCWGMGKYCYVSRRSTWSRYWWGSFQCNHMRPSHFHEWLSQTFWLQWTSRHFPAQPALPSPPKPVPTRVPQIHNRRAIPCKRGLNLRSLPLNLMCVRT